MAPRHSRATPRCCRRRVRWLPQAPAPHCNGSRPVRLGPAARGRRRLQGGRRAGQLKQQGRSSLQGCLAAAGMKKGVKETRVESEGGGALAAAEAVAGHRPTRLTKPLPTIKCSTARRSRTPGSGGGRAEWGLIKTRSCSTPGHDEIICCFTRCVIKTVISSGCSSKKF